MKIVTIFRWFLIVTEASICIAAFFGAYGLLTNSLGLDKSLLKETPFANFTIPALLLLVSVGIPMMVADLVLIRLPRVGEFLSEFAGLLLVAWIVMQLLLIGYTSYLQLLMLCMGIGICITAAELHEFEVRG